MTRVRAAVAVPLVLWLSLVACGDDDESAQIDFHVPVSVDEVKTGTMEDVVEATGTLRAASEATLSTEAVGRLRLSRNGDGRRLEEGDHVAVGQTIAIIEGDDPRLAARVESARARFNQARMDHESQRRLQADGIVNDLAVTTAESALVAARQDLEQAELTAAKTAITSPIAGVLVELARGKDGTRVADGQRVNAGLQIARVLDVTSLVAELDLAGGEIVRVQAGQPVAVEHYAIEGELAGVVTRTSPVIDPTTRTFRVDVRIAAPGALRPGMFVKARIVTERREDVVVVPRHAVLTRGGDSVVFVVESQKAVQRKVVTGIADDDTVEIREGVAAGDRLVTAGYETLVDGTRVRIGSG